MQPYQSRIPAGPPFAAFGPENVEKQKKLAFLPLLHASKAF
jgi:hypothetical protein